MRVAGPEHRDVFVFAVDRDTLGGKYADNSKGMHDAQANEASAPEEL
jgi:hypothetical protein